MTDNHKDFNRQINYLSINSQMPTEQQSDVHKNGRNSLTEWADYLLVHVGHFGVATAAAAKAFLKIITQHRTGAGERKQQNMSELFICRDKNADLWGNGDFHCYKLNKSRKQFWLECS